MNKEIDINLLHAHPLNRDFDRMGESWVAMVESVRTHGVVQPLLVRPLEDAGYQILAGHRRAEAAAECGLQFLDCAVREMTDREALELLVIENLERENPDPVEEGKLLRALAAEGVEAEVLAHRLKRSVAWITTRQRLLDLGDEVMAAVRLPRDVAGHLGMGTVEVLLGVAEGADRARAIQMVLHPEWASEVLGPREAAEVIRATILEPARKRAAWEKECKGLVKAWRKSLGTYLTREEKKDLVVQALRYEELAGCRLRTLADDLIPSEHLTSPDGPSRWVHLAVRHGLPVWVIPCAEDGDESAAVVDEALIRMAEDARRENGLAAALLSAKQLRMLASAGGGEEEEDDHDEAASAVARAAALQAGEGDPNYDPDGPADRVITQTMESRAWVDLGPVRRMRDQLSGLEWPADDMPEDAPEWLRKIWEGEYETAELVAMCDWVLELAR